MNIDYRITAVIAMIFICFSTFFTKLAMKEGLSPRHTFLIFAGIAFVVTFLADISQGGKIWQLVNLSRGPLFAYIGAFLGIIALLLYYEVLGKGAASTVVPIWSLQAVGIGALGVIFLKEPMTSMKAAAIALCLASIYLITRPN